MENRVRYQISQGVCVKTFTEVLEVLNDWYANGYSLYSVDWDCDQCVYFIQGSRVEWREVGSE